MTKLFDTAASSTSSDVRGGSVGKTASLSSASDPVKPRKEDDMKKQHGKHSLPPPPAGGGRRRQAEGNLSVATRMRLKKLSRFVSIKVAQVVCVVYIVILTFSKAPLGLVDPATGRIIDVNSSENTRNGVILVNGDYRAVVATSRFQMICLAMSRMSAFSLYPVMVVVFLSKCKALRSYLGQTPFSLFMVQDVHKLHSYAGKYIAVDVWIHASFHVLRWWSQKNLSLLWESRVGLSGLIVVLTTPLITFPMMFCKKKIPYEVRKGLHYLFYVFAIGMCFHVPVSGIPNGGFIAPVMGFCIVLYTLDALYVTIYMTEKIDKPTFQVLPSGVQMSMPVSERFQGVKEQGGFAYVCLPWVDKTQWHAFSLYENPADLTRREVFMQNAGDWTKDVHRALQRNTARPVWIQGPFESPYNNAELYDNQILIAMGIGITPALSVIQAHRENRRINLIWACRDAAMLEFFLEHMYLDHDGWNLIFYTGKATLSPAVDELNTNVRVIKARPDLHTVIPNIIYGIESKRGLPEKYVPSEMEKAKGLLIERIQELDTMQDMSTKDKVKDLTSLAWRCGFLFTELLNQLDFEADLSAAASASISEEGEDGEMEMAPLTQSTRPLPQTQAGKHSRGGSEVLERVRKIGDRNPMSNSQRSLVSSSPSVQVARGGNPQGRLGPLSKLVDSVLDQAFKPWEENRKARSYVANLDRDTVLSSWGILYCGGSKNKVKRDLKYLSEEYHIALNAESFDF